MPQKSDTRPLTAEEKALCEAFYAKCPNVIGAIVEYYPGTYRWAVRTGLSRDEMVQYAWLGVIHAAKKYDPDYVSNGIYGNRVTFPTYALPWARNALQKPCLEAARMMRTPREGSKVERITPGNQHATRTFDYLVSRATAPDEAAIAGERRERIDAILNRLSSRQRAVIVRRFGLGDGPAEMVDGIAKSLRVSRSTVNDDQAKALSWLRANAAELESV